MLSVPDAASHSILGWIGNRIGSNMLTNDQVHQSTKVTDFESKQFAPVFWLTSTSPFQSIVSEYTSPHSVPPKSTLTAWFSNFSTSYSTSHALHFSTIHRQAILWFSSLSKFFHAFRHPTLCLTDTLLSQHPFLAAQTNPSFSWHLLIQATHPTPSLPHNVTAILPNSITRLV